MNINEKKLEYVIKGATGIKERDAKFAQVLSDIAEISNAAENVVRCIAEHGAPYVKQNRYAQRSQVLSSGDVLIALAVIAIDRESGADVRVHHDGLVVEFKEGWAADCSLRVNVMSNGDTCETISGAKVDDETPVTRHLVDFRFEVSWGSTGRTLSEGAVSARLYMKAIELGQLMELAVNRFRYIAH